MVSAGWGWWFGGPLMGDRWVVEGREKGLGTGCAGVGGRGVVGARVECGSRGGQLGLVGVEWAGGVRRGWASA